ncbi:hypothetical protein [Promicromonospora sukumoe]
MTTTQQPRPYRIVLEGIDGVGKSTLVRALRGALEPERSVLTETMAPVTLDLFRAYGRDVHGAPQAYWSAVSRRTKTQVFLTEGVVRATYLADAYGAYDVVLHDRWWQTFQAYSEPEDFDHRCEFLRDALPEVDLVLYLRGDVEACAARLVADDDWLVHEVGADSIVTFLQQLQDRYDELFADHPDTVVVETGAAGPDAVAATVLGEIRRRLPAPRGAGVQPAVPTGFAHPDPRDVVAVDGIDGAGKSTLVRGVVAALDGDATAARLASVSLDLFRRGAFEDEFRHQTYLVDGLVGLACAAGTSGPLVFDRWFPLAALYQDSITSDRGFFDYLLSRFPEPGQAFYLDLDPADAVTRLQGRGDWMLDSLGASGTHEKLAWMRERQRAAQPGGASVLDAGLPTSELVETVVREIRAYTQGHTGGPKVPADG